jgi:hypothetical protein
MGKFSELHERIEEPDESGFIHNATAQARHPGSIRHEARVKPVGSKYRVTHYQNGKYQGKASDRHFDDKDEAINHANTHVQRNVR